MRGAQNDSISAESDTTETMAGIRAGYAIKLSLSLAGFLFSVSAGSAVHLRWLQTLCAGFAGSCTETTQFTLFGSPLWGWGIAYYLLLAVSVYRFPKWTFWLVSGAVGFETALIWIAVSLKLYCLFCLGNFFVVLLLAVFCLHKDRIWQTLAVGSLCLLFSLLLVPHEAILPAFATGKQARPNVVAEVAGEPITEDELDTPIALHIYDLEEQIYRSKRQRLDRMIAEKVLEKEAHSRNVSVKQLAGEIGLSEEITVTDEEVNSYLLEHRDLVKNRSGPSPDLKDRIRDFLRDRKYYERLMEYSESLGKRYGVAVYLKQPRPPRFNVDVRGDPTIGPSDAPVRIIEFSDYQCPACRKSHEVVRRLQDEYRGRIQWIFKDYPLQMHKYAEKAAEAAGCAADQGKFREYQDALFAADGDLTPDRLRDIAAGLGMNVDQFEACLNQGKHKNEVEQDLAEGRRIGVDSTPSLLINGKLITGSAGLNRLKKMIDRELKEAGAGDR